MQPIDIIQACYRQLDSRQSNVVRELLPADGQPVVQWSHYPKGDIRDPQSLSQYYYHSHPSHDPDRLPEHGHFHLFFRTSIFDSKVQPIAVSPKYKDSQGKQDNLCHLIGISMNEYGLPKAFFTVNHWVVNGLWYRAKDIIPLLHRFQIVLEDSPWQVTNEWMTQMMRLFAPYLEMLLETRDQVIESFSKEYPEVEVLQDRRLEVTSILPL